MPCHIDGKYLLDNVTNKETMLGQLGEGKKMYEMYSKGEGQTFGVTAHGNERYTVQTGHARNTFNIGEWFEHKFMGGQGGFDKKCKSILYHPEENVLKKVCHMPNGVTYKLHIEFREDGCTQHVSFGDGPVLGQRIYKRVDKWTEDQDRLVGHVGDN